MVDALLGLAAKAGGEGFRVLADGGKEFAEGGDLGREICGPVEDDDEGGGVRGDGVFSG